VLLGDILAEMERVGVAGNAVALLDDLVMLAKVNEAAARRGVDAESYVIGAVRCFEREASGEDWTTLISAVAGATNPGSICIKRMVERKILSDSASGLAAPESQNPGLRLGFCRDDEPRTRLIEVKALRNSV